MSFLKTVRTKMGLENQELQQLKDRIMNVETLAQCLNAERARVNSRPVAASAASAASSAYTSLQNADQCSHEELHREIKILRDMQDQPTDELFRYYLSIRNSHGTLSKLNMQIELSPKKEFYEKICSIIEDLSKDFLEQQQREELLDYKRREREVLLRKTQKQLEETLEKSERDLGKYHHNTITLLHNLAGFLTEKGEYDRALPLFEECQDRSQHVNVNDERELTTSPYLHDIIYCKRMIKEQEEQKRRMLVSPHLAGEPLGGRSKSKRNNKNKNKSFRSRRRRYSRARGVRRFKNFAASSSKTMKRR
jgi:tetratricopeptide (TPR) repeat protein